ncbi:chloride channel protein [Geitlerinema sp. PCC 7407]|uniref:chloride channel protein n=1 Tax=Geitlerinema sp. PCC 7407 TaxID=1173025 RepID=UPI00029FD9AC|nr:chloride channel protein [Geitlerinema sp. PCC 7407]AFY64808.1 Cl- channel voltage-gated family protein [Geitlerinema sp. PCC 7407]
MRYPPVLQFVRPLLRPKRTAILEACLIGLVAAFAVVILRQGIGLLGGWRVHLAQQGPAWLVLSGIGAVGGFLAGWLVERVAPETAGSGIPQVKAVLARVPIPLDLRVAAVKLLGAVLALGSGLTLGREGPTIQMGAAIGAQLSRWFPTSPDHRRQLIAAGAGAGLAASFNAPLAGVLFVVEELLRDVSGFTLGTAILASFIGSVVARLLGGRGLDVNLAAVPVQANFHAVDIPFYLLLGLLAGVLGPLFCRGILASLTINRRVLKLSMPWRMALAGCLSGLVVSVLPLPFRDHAGLRASLVTGAADWQTMAIAFGAHAVLTMLAYGSGAPGGLFAPILVLGSALGYMVGAGEQQLLGVGLPTTYALVGMGAFFSAVSHVPITSVVIIFEMTTDFNLVLPLMVGSVVAYFVADKVDSASLYDHLLAWNGIELERSPSAEPEWANLRAADVMQRRVETLASQLSVEEAMQAFSRSHHRGFPVVDDGKLVGIITQSDLAQAAARSATVLRDLMTPQPVTVSPDDTLNQVLYLLNRYKLSRLPVTEGRRLVGIITRADIIRVEADRLTGESDRPGPQTAPSYCVYQTRSPTVGQGRLLVPLGNPQTADLLLQMAVAIARDRHYEIECLRVIQISRHQLPTETSVDTLESRRLLQRAVRLGRDLHIPVHTQIRVAHDPAQAVLETIEERHINLICMGWKGSTTTPGRVFGSTMDTVIRQAACDVMLVKFGAGVALAPRSPIFAEAHRLPFGGEKARAAASLQNFDRWLLPIAGGPNAQRALHFLPGLIALSSHPKVRLYQVFTSLQAPMSSDLLVQDVEFLSQHLNCPVVATTAQDSSVAESIQDLALRDQTDVIVLGATREGLLQQVMQGNIPEAIARKSPCTVILVRGAIADEPPSAWGV